MWGRIAVASSTLAPKFARNRPDSRRTSQDPPSRGHSGRPGARDAAPVRAPPRAPGGNRSSQVARRDAMPDLPIRLPVTRRSAALLVGRPRRRRLLELGARRASPAPAPSAQPRADARAPAVRPPAPTVGAIDHKTGATDVVLRLEQGGGFVPIEFLATQAPELHALRQRRRRLPADRRPTSPQPDANGVVRGIPWRTGEARRGPDPGAARVRARPGRPRHRPGRLHVGQASRTRRTRSSRSTPAASTRSSSSTRLGGGTARAPTPLARTAFCKLAQRLQDFDRGGTIASDVYQPDRYRGDPDRARAQPGPWRSPGRGRRSSPPTSRRARPTAGPGCPIGR